MKIHMMAAVMLLGATGAWAADPVEGLWKTKPDDNGNYGHVEIAPCGAKLCGVLVKGFDSTGAQKPSDNIGKQIVWDMVANGDGTYGGGKVWAPDRDKTYNSKMSLSGDVLSVSGCVLGGLICRAQDWNRVK
ncbi:MAG: DUF2147 domain-containing protein [Rhodobacteraceae bacterium]|nr:DUF2147 domain-containing protein [Paracoccaceae bacterium]